MPTVEAVSQAQLTKATDKVLPLLITLCESIQNGKSHLNLYHESEFIPYKITMLRSGDISVLTV